MSAAEAAPEATTAKVSSQMVEGGPLKGLADLMLLGDDYDRRARYAPAALAVAPLAVAAFSMSLEHWNLLVGVGLASFVQIALTSLFAQIGRTIGSDEERRLMQSGQMPMQRWLCPHNKERSELEVAEWTDAVREVTGLDYSKAETCNDCRRLGRDVFVALQARLRVDDSAGDKPSRPLHRIHQEEYGFARNLVGMKMMWFWSLVIGLAATTWQWAHGVSPFPLVVVEIIFVLCWLAVVGNSDYFVMNGAERLSESLLNGAVARAETDRKVSSRAHVRRNLTADAPSTHSHETAHTIASHAAKLPRAIVHTIARGSSEQSHEVLPTRRCEDCGRYWSGDLIRAIPRDDPDRKAHVIRFEFKLPSSS
jgi:hypothetical protein